MRLSLIGLKVLSHFLANGDTPQTGAMLTRALGIGSGTLYPLLLKLEGGGLLTGEWEDGDPSALGRPRRRYYRLTGVGATRTRAEINGLNTAIVSRPGTVVESVR